MRFECYGESLTPERGRADGDTFLVDCEETPLIALCDSIPHAGRPPRRTLELFRRLFAQAQPEEIGRFSTWAHWMGLLDFALLRRSQSAFVAGAHLRHVAAVPPAVLQAAASRSDISRDMTVAALQRIE
jgi:hypothetical protein